MFGTQQLHKDSAPPSQMTPHFKDDPPSHGLFITDVDLDAGILHEVIFIEPVSFTLIFKVHKSPEENTYRIQRLSSPSVFLNEEVLGNEEEKVVKAGDIIRFQLSTSEEYEWQFFSTMNNFQQKRNHKAEDYLKDEVICSFCLKCMHHPTTLSPCLHSFCSSCLSRHLFNYDSCPLCREKIAPARKNFLLNKLMIHLVKNNPDLEISQSDRDFMDIRDRLFEGADIKRYEDGSFYYGFFKNKQREGTGKLIGDDQSVYNGMWKDDKKRGFGECNWIDGRAYRGEWKNDERDGVGEMVWPDGARYYGFWENDDFHGPGVFFWPDGRQLEGEWRNGIYDAPYY